MKKFYFVPSLLTALAFIVNYIAPTLAIGLFFFIPIGMYWYLHRNDADIFLKPSTVKKRICMIALSNRQLVAFVAKKINQNWLRIGNYFIELIGEDEYIYKGKILTFSRQRKGMDVEKILKLKQKLNPGFLSKRVFFSQKFMQSMAFPIVGTVMLIIPLIPSVWAWVVLVLGPHYLLYEIWSSGALEFAGGQGAGEITVFYIMGSRKVKPVTAEIVGEKWFTYKGGLGHVKTLDTTDYYFHGKRIFFSGAKVPTTFSLEHAEKAHWFRRIGLRDWNELMEAMSIVEEADEDYDSFENAHRKIGRPLIEKVRNNLKEEQEVKSVAER